MQFVFDLFLFMIWLYAISRGIVTAFRQRERLRWSTAGMWLLVLIGFGGFFGTIFAAEGYLKLPSSFEWPAGYAAGVVRMPNGDHVVPLANAARLQIYNADWKFLRGWHVSAGGGDFTVECSDGRALEVYTARGNHHYTFTEEGELLASANYDKQFGLPHRDASHVVVPTSPFGWIFSSPAISWGIGVLGFIGLGLIKKFANRASAG